MRQLGKVPAKGTRKYAEDDLGVEGLSRVTKISEKLKMPIKKMPKGRGDGFEGCEEDVQEAVEGNQHVKGDQEAEEECEEDIPEAVEEEALEGNQHVKGDQEAEEECEEDISEAVEEEAVEGNPHVEGDQKAEGKYTEDVTFESMFCNQQSV